MPSVFLCHASEDKAIVEPMQLALAGAGYDVFYDKNSLPPGGDYQERIASAIKRCDLFIFVASPSSIKPGKFTLTELKFARERWSSPVGRVLPVTIDGVKTRDLPAYLKATTVLEVIGDPAAEVRAESEKMITALVPKRRRWLFALVGVAVLAAAATVLLLDRTEENVFKIYKNAALTGCNDKRFTEISVEQCKVACIDTTEFKCQSFDYYREKNICDLSKSTQGPNCPLKTDYPGNPYDHYELVGNTR